ncbi:MAG: DUF4173 domain-containing protein, partial [Rhodococcus sp. (in: high G+C Gram-positive bacteria)]
IGAGMAGLIGSLVLGDGGLGYPIVTAAILVVAACANPWRTTTWWHGAGAAAVLALSAVAVFRAADWLVTLSAWLAVFVAGAVLSRSWTWTGTVLGALAPVLVPFRVIRWTTRGSARMDTGNVRPGRIALVTAVTLALLAVFAALFAGADPQFEKLLDSVTPQWDPAMAIGELFVFAFVAGGALAASYLAVNPPRFDGAAPRRRGALHLWELAVPLTALVLLFGAFVFVQIRTLFGGQQYVLVTDGLTNAEYARQGFWQLLAVTALTLLVMAVAIRKAPRDSTRERTWLRFLLGTLCLLSLVVVASALHRMSLYEQQYGFTTLRLFVTAVELWLGSVFVLVMATGIRMSGNWLPRAVGVTAVLAVLGLAVIDPDAYIARHNVERFAETGKIDAAYLSRLSEDAAPELDKLPEPTRSCAMARYEAVGTWTEWNVATMRADHILRDHPIGACAYNP